MSQHNQNEACSKMKSSTCIGFNNKNNKEDTKFEFGDHVKLSKYKNIFPKDYTPNWFES